MSDDNDTAQAARYTLVIQWSDEDQEYVVTLSEWEAAGWHGHTGGPSYEEAAKKGRAMIESYIWLCEQEGRALPAPQVFVAA